MMLKEKLELYVEAYFRPFKKDLVYQEKKLELIDKLQNKMIQYKNNNGLTEQEIYSALIKDSIEEEMRINLNELTIDKNNTLHYVKKIFSNENLEDLPLLNVEFRICDFKDASIENREINYTVFKNCYLKKFTVNNSTILNSCFKKCDLSLSNYSNCKVTDSSFNDSHLNKANFENSFLLNTTFKNCYLNKVSFKNTKLINVQFESCTLSKIDFTGAIMDKMTLRFLVEELGELTEIEII